MTKSNSKPALSRLLLTLGLMSVSTVPALAAGQSNARPDIGHRPVHQIATDLDIEDQEFITCFRNVRPARNHSPSGERQRANKAVLLSCLQKANPEITNERLDQVMDTYRPEGPNGRKGPAPRPQQRG